MRLLLIAEAWQTKRSTTPTHTVADGHWCMLPALFERLTQVVGSLTMYVQIHQITDAHMAHLIRVVLHKRHKPGYVLEMMLQT